MLEKQTRELPVKSYEKSYNVSEAARNFSVNRTTVYNYINKNNISFEVRTNLRGRKPKLTQKNPDEIRSLIEEQNDMTIHEITERLGLTVSDETVRRAVIKMGYVYKKKSLYASERERSRCRCKKKKTD